MKIKRQLKIIELIQEHDIDTQKELSDRLKKLGYNVTQATVSRDIRELELTKVSTQDGKQKYSVLQTTPARDQPSERLIRVFKDAIIKIDYSQNIMVIKTLQGMAMAVGAALDSMGYTEIVGSIAGDDTLFCVVRSENQLLALMDKLMRIINLTPPTPKGN